MNENGWILLSRKLLDWQWWGKAEMVKLWLYLLLSANIEDKKWQGIEVKRGQLVTSIQHLTEALGLSTKQVRTALQRLKDGGEITVKTTNKFSLITICNYRTYQDYDPSQGQTNGNQGASQGQTNGNQGATTKQLNNKQDNNLSLSRTREKNENFFSREGQPQTSEPTFPEGEKEKSSAQKEKDFTPPTESQVKDFCQMNGLLHVNPVGFVAYYEAVGWTINGRPMKNWRAAAVNWNEREKQKIYQQQKTASSNGNLNNGQKGATRHASCEPRTDVSADEF